MATTFRADLRTAVVASLDIFIAANPTLLRRSELVQPPSPIGDLPLAYVDYATENIRWDSQTMDRVITMSVVVVRPMADNTETLVASDSLTDKLVDHFNTVGSTGTQFVPNSIWSEMSISNEDYPVESDDGVRHFFATRMTFVVSKMEGRA